MRIAFALSIAGWLLFVGMLLGGWLTMRGQTAFAPECSAEQAEVLGPGTYKCLTLENGTRRWWRVEDE